MNLKKRCVYLQGTVFFCGPKRAQALSEMGVAVSAVTGPKGTNWCAAITPKLIECLNRYSDTVEYRMLKRL